jgi:NitT/TauT family transport system permease protein
MRARNAAWQSVALPALFLAATILAWQLADHWLGWDKVIAPNPVEVAQALVNNWSRLISNGLVTLAEAVFGFVLGSILGCSVALVSVRFRMAGRILIPYAVAIKAVPIVVLAPLLVMWLGNDMLSKVVMAATAVFFPILINAVVALTSVEREWVALLRLHGASDWQVFWMLRVPHALPQVFAGMRVGTSLAMVGAVVGEFTGASRGLGHLITTSTYYLNTDLVFAGVIVLAALGMAFYAVVTVVHRSIVFWVREQ